MLHTSLSQPDLFTSMDSPQSDVATVVSYAVNSSGNAVNSSGNSANGNGAAAAAILDTLKNDNRDMKGEIFELRKKVSKVAMLEEEMAKVHQVNYFQLVYPFLQFCCKFSKIFEKQACSRSKLVSSLRLLKQRRVPVNQTHILPLLNAKSNNMWQLWMTYWAAYLFKLML